MESIFVQAAVIAAVFGTLYVALVRPQQKRLERHRQMLQSLRPGDRVATTGGLVGHLVEVGDDRIAIVEIAAGIRVTIVRDRIDAVIAHTADGRHEREEAPAAQRLAIDLSSGSR